MGQEFETDILAKARVGVGTLVPEAPLHSVGKQVLEFSGVPIRNANNVLQFNKNSNGPTDPGAIVITLPFGWVNTMIKIKISGFSYSGSTGPWDATIFGYASTISGGGWVNQAAYLEGRPSFERVRLGYDGTNAVIILGETNTQWAWTKFVVDSLSGHSTSYGLAVSGTWTAQLVTDLSPYSLVEECPLINPNFNIDGGAPNTNYGSVSAIDGGVP